MASGKIFSVGSRAVQRRQANLWPESRNGDGDTKEMGKHGSRVDIWMKYSVGTRHEGSLIGLPHLLEPYAFTNLIFDRVSITRF